MVSYVKKRPLSPHLQIYKPQITSVLSITHRMTGIALALGFVGIAFWLFAVILGDEYYHPFLYFFSTSIGKLALIGWTWALFYHMCNGVRHLAWDAGYGFALKTVTWSGWLVVAASLIFTLVAWWFGACCGCYSCHCPATTGVTP